MSVNGSKKCFTTQIVCKASFKTAGFGGLYYKHITIVNDDHHK